MITIVNSGYNNLAVLGRDTNGKRTIEYIKNKYPYFYVEEAAEIPKNDKIIKIEKGFVSIDNMKLQKLVFKTPRDVKDFRGAFRNTWEDDIQFVDRYLLDNVNSVGNDIIRTWFLDLEMDARIEFPQPTEAKYAIIMITFYDDLTDKFVLFTWRNDLTLSKFTKKIK